MTETEGLPIASLRITADGRTLVYVRGSETDESGRVADPTNGVWSRKQQVWAVDVDAGTPRTPASMGCPEEECEDVELSPDGQFAVWAARKQLTDCSKDLERRRPISSPISVAITPSRNGHRRMLDRAGQQSRRSQLYRGL